MNYTMNTLKAIGIILVVCGHLENAILSWFHPYTFHMPLFIFISGYFYKTKHENACISYIKNKFKAWVLPYYGWNVFYGVLITVFLVNSIIGFGSKINFKNLLIEPWLTGHQYIFNLAGWFVPMLFLVSVIYLVTRKLLSPIFKSEYIFTIFYFVCSLIAVYLAGKGYREGFELTVVRALFGVIFFHIGFLYKTKLEKYDKFNFAIIMSVIAIQGYLVYLSNNNLTFTMAFMTFQSNKVIIPFIVSFTGIYLYLHCAKMVTLCNQGKDKIINLIGNSTWSIMLHHLFGFWLLNLLFLKLHNMGIGAFANFDVNRYYIDIWYRYLVYGEFTYILYFIAGIGTSLIFELLLRKSLGMIRYLLIIIAKVAK